MTLKEKLDTLQPTTLIKIGTDYGNGYFFIGTVRDFFALNINEIDIQLRKNVIKAIKYNHEEQAKWITHKSRQKQHELKEVIATEYLDTIKPLLSRQIKETAKGLYEPSINIVIEGRESGAYYISDEAKDEPFKLFSNPINLSMEKDEDDNC